jgi:RNA polymerase sigma-70 factor (ECF subfamily)
LENHTHITSNYDLDEEAILRQSQIDAQSFKPIYEKYFKKVYLFLYRRASDRELAGDLTQQVFLKALLALDKFQFRGIPFSAWLFRIAVNEANEFFRKTNRTRWVSIDDRTVQRLHDELTYDTTTHDLSAQLPSLLLTLKEDELQLIQLRFFEGLSFKEVGDILEVTENNAKVKTYRTLEKLKKNFIKPY